MVTPWSVAHVTNLVWRSPGSSAAAMMAWLELVRHRTATAVIRSTFPRVKNRVGKTEKVNVKFDG